VANEHPKSVSKPMEKRTSWWGSAGKKGENWEKNNCALIKYTARWAYHAGTSGAPGVSGPPGEPKKDIPYSQIKSGTDRSNLNRCQERSTLLNQTNISQNG